MNQTYQPDYKPYEKKYGDLLTALAKAYAETAAVGDEIGLYFLLTSVEALTDKADRMIRQVHKQTGSA